MALFRNRPIRTKLNLVIMFTVVTSLLLASAGFVINEIITFRQIMVNDLSTIADLIGTNSTAALTFDNKVDASENLYSLSSRPGIISAAIYDREGQLFAEYTRDSISMPAPRRVVKDGHEFDVNRLTMVKPIIFQKNRLGTIFLQSSLDVMYAQVRAYIQITAVVLLLSLLSAFLLGTYLQRRLSRPILHLAEVSRTISEKGDYSVRAQKEEKDELGTLADAFNGMLDQIDERRQRLLEANEGLRREITERVKAEKALQESQSRLAGLIDSAMDAVVTVNAEQKIILFNPAAERVFGCRATDALGQSLDKFIPARLRQDHRHHIEHFSKTGVTARRMGALGALTGLRANGEEFPIEASISQMEVGEEKLFTVILRDITERERAQEALRQSEEQLRLVTDATPALISFIDNDLVYRFVNRQYEIWFGVKREQVVGQPMDSVLGEAAKTKVQPYLDRVRQGEHVHFEAEVPYKEGGTRWIDASYIPKKDDLGNTTGFYVFVVDITKRIEAEYAVRESEARFRQLANTAPVLIWVNDPEGCIFANRAYLDFLGVGEVDVRKYDWAKYVHPDDRENYINTYSEALKHHGRFERQFRFRRYDGEYRWMKSIASPRFTSTGEFIGYVGSTTDITELKNIEVELERRVQERTTQLVASNKELEAFSYSVSHDLRAPLRAISGYAGMLQADANENLTQNEKRYLSLIGKNAIQMGILVDGLLNFSRLGRKDLECQPIDMRDLFRTTLDEQRAIDEENRRKVEVHVHDDIPSSYGDPTLIRQVVANLVSNALKFTGRKDDARIEIGSLPSVNGENTVTYYVKDNGAGFDMQYKEKLFGVFQRLHHFDEFEGTGVGLAFSKRIIERHGGKIWAEGRVDEGAIFYFTLPNG